MKKRIRTNRHCSEKFKQDVILDKRCNQLSYAELIRKHWHLSGSEDTHTYVSRIHLWEKHYWEQGEQGLMDNQYQRNLRLKGTSINFFLILEATPKSPVFAIYWWLLYE